MTEEEKKAAEEADFQKSLEGLSDEDKAAKQKEREVLSKKDDTDIKEALEAERKRREKAEADLAETRRKSKEAYEARKKKKNEFDEDEEEDEDDKPLTRREFQESLAQEREIIRKEANKESAKKLARGLSESDSEAELVLEVWQNRTLPGSLEEQITEAHAIAISKRLKSKNSELQRALVARDRENNDGSNAQRKSSPASEPNLNPVDKTVITGMTWDSSRGAYKKLIAGKKKLFFVSRDLKKRWVEDA